MWGWPTYQPLHYLPLENLASLCDAICAEYNTDELGLDSHTRPSTAETKQCCQPPLGVSNPNAELCLQHKRSQRPNSKVPEKTFQMLL